MTESGNAQVRGMSEAGAIEGSKRGDGECFEFLYELHKRRVYSLCLHMTGKVELAEDLTQEAFLQLYREIAGFRGESAFSTWLYRLTINVVLMRLRKQKSEEVSLEATLEPTEGDELRTDFGSEDQKLAGSIDSVGLERAIDSLPRGYRIIFVLHDIEGYEHNEIAEMLGCSIGSSTSQLHEARLHLRDRLTVIRKQISSRPAPRKMKGQQKAKMAAGRNSSPAAVA